jgi:RNA polymerase sigma factor (sigma-70 family)
VGSRVEFGRASAGEQLLRDLAPQVLGAVVRRFGDFSAAEDAVQDALIAATSQWPRDGLPENPRGWLIQVAARRMTDHIRSESARRRRESDAAGPEPIDERLAPEVDAYNDASAGDDTLTLLFMCCHSALTPPSAIALTLRAIGGLTTAEIANAFLVPEATMAQRISRAKRSIKSSGVQFSVPSPSERAERLGAVLHVLYLMFNEGYASSIGPHLLRPDLASEAIRLARIVHRLLPDVGEVAGLLALLLLTDARRPARTGADGELIPLDEQDRSLWNRPVIDEGVALVTRTLGRGRVGVYQVQAAIAAVHDEAPSAAGTDWPQILALYDVLRQLDDNPMVGLNHAVAAAMVHGPATGLTFVAALERDPRLAGHYRIAAVRGHLLERTNNLEAAIAQYRLAASGTASLPERHYLTTCAARVAERLTVTATRDAIDRE